MNKIKIVTVMIATLFVSTAVASVAGAVELEGEISVEMIQFIGLVCPTIDIGNQTGLAFNVEKFEGNASANETDTYRVVDTLKIKVNVTDNTGRDIFFFPRSLVTSVWIVRDDPKSSGPFGPVLNKLMNLLPFRKRVSFDVTGEEEYIELALNYTTDNTTLSENLTMHIFAIGMLPGNINGLGERIPIISHKEIHLIDVAYNLPPE